MRPNAKPLVRTQPELDNVDRHSLTVKRRKSKRQREPSLRGKIRGVLIESRVVRIEKRGNFVELIKITGTNHFPRTALTEHVAVVIALKKDLEFLGNLLFECSLVGKNVDVHIRFRECGNVVTQSGNKPFSADHANGILDAGVAKCHFDIRVFCKRKIQIQID